MIDKKNIIKNERGKNIWRDIEYNIDKEEIGLGERKLYF
jgi:hypothetical protein